MLEYLTFGWIKKQIIFEIRFLGEKEEGGGGKF